MAAGSRGAGSGEGLGVFALWLVLIAGALFLDFVR
jgi:hypothetical protein